MGHEMAANPDLKNGFARLADELTLALAKTYFTPKQIRVLFYLIHETYGFKDYKKKIYGRKMALVPTQQWVDGTGLDKAHVYRALRELIARGIVARNGHKYGLQTDYMRWERVARSRHRENSGQFTPQNGGQKRPPIYKGNSLLEREEKNPAKRCSSCHGEFIARAEWHDRCDSCFSGAKTSSPYDGYVSCSLSSCSKSGPPSMMRLDDQGICYFCRQERE